jgi:hypothetical protein
MIFLGIDWFLKEGHLHDSERGHFSKIPQVQARTTRSFSSWILHTTGSFLKNSQFERGVWNLNSKEYQAFEIAWTPLHPVFLYWFYLGTQYYLRKVLIWGRFSTNVQLRATFKVTFDKVWLNSYVQLYKYMIRHKTVKRNTHDTFAPCRTLKTKKAWIYNYKGISRNLKKACFPQIPNFGMDRGVSWSIV